MLHREGFSLVELSIVLVILGLLTGGILTGQNLIRAAELRSVTTDFQAYQTAVRTFQDKYFYLPGDMPNATDFWGAKSDCYNDFPPGTCNGTGDGMLQFDFEDMHFWQHLSLAGLISGNYSGIRSGSHATARVRGVDIPASKISPGAFAAGYVTVSPSIFNNFHHANVIFLANYSADWSDQPLLSAEEVWNLDKKMDDGNPGYGIIGANTTDSPNVSNCTTSNTPSNAKYNISSSGPVCNIIFKVN